MTNQEEGPWGESLEHVESVSTKDNSDAFDMFDALEKQADNMPTWLSYVVFLYEGAKKIILSIIMGGATFLYMNTFSNIAIYIFIVAICLMYLIRLLLGAFGLFFGYGIIRLIKKIGRGRQLGRIAVVSVMISISQFLAYFLAIHSFSRYFSQINELTFQIAEIPILRTMIFGFEFVERNILQSTIVTGSVTSIITELGTASISLLVLSSLGFLWRRGK